MRAILIDPIAKDVYEVDFQEPYTNIYGHLSDREHDFPVDTFTIVRLNDKQPVYDSVFVDDEGLFKAENRPRWFFQLKHYAQPLCGRGLVLGCNEEGDSVATTLSARDVRRLIMGFTELVVLGFDHFEGKTGPDHPLGEGAFIIGNRPKFEVVQPLELPLW